MRFVEGLALLTLGGALAGTLRAQTLPRPDYCTALRAPVAPPELRVHSMLPALKTWSDQSGGLSPAAQRDAFRRTVLEPEGDLFGLVFRRPDDETLGDYLEWMRPRLPAVFALGGQVDTLLAPTAARMAVLFPELQANPVDVIVGATLGRSNGTVRLRNGHPVLILGLDVETVVSDRASMTTALIEHELVHVAHARANPAVYAAVDRGLSGRESALYLSLFSEGLAVWASSCASPGRTTEELTFSPTLAAAADSVWSAAAPKLAAVLESTSPDVVAEWFHLGVNPSGHPERFAYWAGVRVVARMACTRSPAALLRLSESDILHEVRAALTPPPEASAPAACTGGAAHDHRPQVQGR